MFYQACLTIFNLSATDPAVALIANRALYMRGERRGIRFVVLLHGILFQMKLPRLSDDMLQTMSLKKFAKGFISGLRALVVAFFACIWLILKLQFLRLVNCKMNIAGDRRTYKEWIQLADTNVVLVREGLPPNIIQLLTNIDAFKSRPRKLEIVLPALKFAQRHGMKLPEIKTTGNEQLS